MSLSPDTFHECRECNKRFYPGNKSTAHDRYRKHVLAFHKPSESFMEPDAVCEGKLCLGIPVLTALFEGASR